MEVEVNPSNSMYEPTYIDFISLFLSLAPLYTTFLGILVAQQA